MTAYINKWTLEIENVSIPAKYIKEEEKHCYIFMKGITILATLTLLYDLINLFAFQDNDSDLWKKQVFFTLLSDVILVIVTIIFFIILPHFKFYFNGIGTIPMVIGIVSTVECLIHSYANYEDIAG